MRLSDFEQHQLDEQSSCVLDQRAKRVSHHVTTLVPAYGRDYKSADAVRAAWDGFKDFVIYDPLSPDDGRYTAKGDWYDSEVRIRYDGKKKVVNVKG